MSTPTDTATTAADSKPTKSNDPQVVVTTTPIPDKESADVSSSTETEWKITIKNGDGAANEIMLSPTNAKNPLRQEINIYLPAAKMMGDNEDMEKSKEQAAPISPQYRWYAIIQQFLTAVFSIIIIFVEALTLAKYRSTQNVAGAWPKNPLLTPTYVLLAMAVLSCTADLIALGMNWAYGKVKNTLMNMVEKIRASMGFLQAIATAAGAGYFQWARTSSGGADLWGWSCLPAADAMQTVNASGTLCETNTVAWWLAVLKTVLHVLTVVMALWALFNPQGTFADNSAEATQLLGDSQDQETKIQTEFGPPATK